MIDWRQWRIEPALAAGLIVLGWGYGMLAGPLRARLAPGEPFPKARASCFYAALALFFLAVESPAGWTASVYLFSGHMAQVLVIVYPVAVLALLGIPAWMADAFLGRPGVRRIARRLLRPSICGALFVLGITAWHLPRALERALEEPAVLAVQHASLFLVALLFWWPLASPSRLFPPISFAGRTIYLFAVEVGLTALFSYLLMADHAIYPTYEYAPRLIPALDAVDDQVLGGVLVSAVSSFVLVAVLGATFYRWAKSHRQ